MRKLYLKFVVIPNPANYSLDYELLARLCAQVQEAVKKKTNLDEDLVKKAGAACLLHGTSSSYKDALYEEVCFDIDNLVDDVIANVGESYLLREGEINWTLVDSDEDEYVQ